MNRQTCLMALVIASFGTVSRGAELVVMATNTSAVPGAKVYTIGAQITQDEVLKGGANPALYIQELFLGTNVLNSSQTNAYNPKQLQTIQAQYIDPAAENNPVAPSFGAGPPINLSAACMRQVGGTAAATAGSRASMIRLVIQG
jgi:hypothetical protein